jgi:hypothetical protein
MNAQWEQVKVELEKLAIQHGGRLTPELVVEWARANPDSALYQYFTWDVERAAYERWLDQARELIRRVRVEVQVEDKTYYVSAYVRDPNAEPREQGYVSLSVLQRDPDQARMAALHELIQAEGHLWRACDLAVVLEVREAAERALAMVQEAKARLERM